jgi:GNAT superfamily N-acetyltransferase
MRLLIDTNVLIPLEPDASALAMNTAAAALSALAAEAHAQLLLHPAIERDIARDRDTIRRRRLGILAGKYPRLEKEPRVPAAMATVVGLSNPGSNDWVDNQLLAAVFVDAVDFLITEDQGIHAKARHLSLADRVLTIADAVGVLRALFDYHPTPPPSVELIRAIDIATTDPILDSLRGDYEPDFDDWLVNAKRQGRQGWAVRAPDGHLAAVVLIKKEERGYGMRGKLLKLSTFKVSERHRGFKYGELLLKAVFRHAHENKYDFIYVTVFPKHVPLRQLFEDFGFYESDYRSALGEMVLAKRLTPLPGDEQLSPLDFHIRRGPPALRMARGRSFIIPIRPEYHKLLFPEAEKQLTLNLDASGRPFGNALRKAYLSHSGIRRLRPGDVLLFYRSKDLHAVTIVGVVEDTMVSTDPQAIARFVARRTVYRFDEIVAMTHKSVLAVIFRQDRLLSEALSIDALVSHRVVERPPQTIGVVKDEGNEWLRTRLAA